MPTTSTARIANDSPFCEAYAAMDKIVERLMAMAGEGATADKVTRLLASDGTALLRDMMQAYVDRCSERERRVEVVGADGVERREARNAKRMAEVAAVYTLKQWPRAIEDVLHGLRSKETEARRPRPTSKRVWASIAHSAQHVIDDAFAEAVRRDPDLRRRWIVLVDGNRDQLRYIKRAARKVGVELTIVLDIVHVLEYLWKAAYAFQPAGTTEAETWVENRFLSLLKGQSGPGLAYSLRQMIVSLRQRCVKV